MERETIILVLVILLALIVSFSLLYMYWNSLGPFQIQIEGLTPGAIQKARIACITQCTSVGGGTSLSVEVEITGDGVADTVNCATGTISSTDSEAPSSFGTNWGTFNTNTCQFSSSGSTTSCPGGCPPGYSCTNGQCILG